MDKLDSIAPKGLGCDAPNEVEERYNLTRELRTNAARFESSDSSNGKVTMTLGDGIPYAGRATEEIDHHGFRWHVWSPNRVDTS